MLQHYTTHAVSKQQTGKDSSQTEDITPSNIVNHDMFMCHKPNFAAIV